MGYQHTQQSPLYLILMAIAALLVVNGGAFLGQHLVSLIMFVMAGAFALLGLMFKQLTISDEGDALAVRFGPLPAFGTSIRYDEITSVETGRTKLIDGWGIHYIPGRGSTYNLWGYGCVKLEVDGRTIRLGTDDGEALAAFLREKARLPAADGPT